MINTPRLILRPLNSNDINATYLSWLNDPSVNAYLETRFLPQTLESLNSYWEEHRDDASNPWFAICLKEDERHIGNIKLGPINWIHRRADVSLFIGDSNCWGSGYATESISALTEWAFVVLDLQKLNAGIYADNIGSCRAFEKCGFELEAKLRSEVFINGQRSDVFRFGLPRSSWNQL